MRSASSLRLAGRMINGDQGKALHSLRPPSIAAQDTKALIITEGKAGVQTIVVRLGAHILSIGSFAKICHRVTLMVQQSQDKSIHLWVPFVTDRKSRHHR